MFASLLSPLVFATPLMAESVQTGNQAEQAATVNINQASAEQLAKGLQGVGMARAKAIIELREKLGRFTDMEQLLEVRGLGIRVLENNQDRIVL
ncbi:competence protein ComEA [Aliidiomarina minuta]|uniref:Competence protein ComEA n=2 Tax=Aliidiomarina minuta TaxID=880057 RepID=A0A432WAA3_9GAMM|nr:competence protein ComEA [Aliidiomarina minuta]